MFEKLILARIVHIISVVLWIGGVAMVTTVIIPSVKAMKDKEERIKTFEKIEGKFSQQAKITTVLTFLSGIYMIYSLELWSRFYDYKFWWMHAMVIIWLLFTIVLFILEPLFLHKLFISYANKNPEKTFNFIHVFHWILLILSLISIFGAVAGSHGWFFI